MATLSELLDRPATSTEAPKPLPVGTYLCLVEGQPEFTKVGAKGTDVVIFRLKLLQAQNDVNQEELQKSLSSKNGSYRALQDVKLQHRLFVTEDSLYRLNNFLLNDLGLDGEGRSTKQLIPEAMGRQFLATFGHRTSEDGSRVYMDVKDTARV